MKINTSNQFSEQENHKCLVCGCADYDTLTAVLPRDSDESEEVYLERYTDFFEIENRVCDRCGFIMAFKANKR